MARAARVYTAHDLSSDRGVKSPRRSSDGSRARRPVPVRAVLCCAVHAAAVPVHGGRWDWEVGRARPTSVRAGCGSKGRRGRGRGAAGVESVLGPRPSAERGLPCRPRSTWRWWWPGWLAGWPASGARGSSGALAFKAQRQVTGEGRVVWWVRACFLSRKARSSRGRRRPAAGRSLVGVQVQPLTTYPTHPLHRPQR